MSAARRVLFVGGTADGEWLAIPDGHTFYRVPVPVQISARDFFDPTPSPELRTHDYQIQRFMALGRVVWVAVFADLPGRDRDVATIRALFHRDVAAELTRGL